MVHATRKYPIAGHVQALVLAAGLLIVTACSDAPTSFDSDAPTELILAFEQANPGDVVPDGAAHRLDGPSLLRGRFWSDGAVRDAGEYDETMSGQAHADEKRTVFIERTLTGRMGTLKVLCAGCVIEGTELVRGRFEIRGATGRYVDFENATAMIDPHAEIDEDSIRRVTFALR